MRKAALAAGGFALMLTLSACGDDGDSQGNTSDNDQGGPAATFDSMDKLVGAAQESTTQSQTAKFSMEMEAEGESLDVTGEGRFTSENPAMVMNMEAQGQQAEVRFIGTTMYVQSPVGELPGGKSWVEISPDGDDPMSQMMGAQFEETAKQMDVSDMLEQMKAGGTITNTEETELDGEPATHYSIDYNLKKAIEEQDSAMGLSGEEVAQMQDQLPEEVPMEFWVNEQQLPMQIIMDMESVMESMDVPAGSVGPMVMRYTDWGTPVDIEEPPADEVADISEMMSMPEMGETDEMPDMDDMPDLDDMDDLPDLDDLDDLPDLEDLPN